jgi:hypothetical protein
MEGKTYIMWQVYSRIWLLTEDNCGGFQWQSRICKDEVQGVCQDDAVVHVCVWVHYACIWAPRVAQLQQPRWDPPKVLKWESCIFRYGGGLKHCHGSHCRLQYGVEARASGESQTHPHDPSATMRVLKVQLQYNWGEFWVTIPRRDRLSPKMKWIEFSMMKWREPSM